MSECVFTVRKGGICVGCLVPSWLTGSQARYSNPHCPHPFPQPSSTALADSSTAGLLESSFLSSLERHPSMNDGEILL